jgi:hypothetical protein
MDRASANTFDASVFEIGKALHDAAASSRPQLFRARGLRGALLAQALVDQESRRSLFQFIDVLPQRRAPSAVAEHNRAYLERGQPAGTWGRVMAPGSHPAMAWTVRLSVKRMAGFFLSKEKKRFLAHVIHDIARAGATVTVDAEGEAVLTGGVQPFGGCRLSLTGTQAGGQDYRKQSSLPWSRIVTENTIRHRYVA